MVGKNKVRVFIAIILLLPVIWGISCAPAKNMKGMQQTLNLSIASGEKHCKIPVDLQTALQWNHGPQPGISNVCFNQKPPRL